MLPSDGVPALVASIREHKKFKQLANYSIECLCKVIQPQNARWRENLAQAVQCGAGEVVMEVLELHKSKEDAVAVCINCLERLSASPQAAEKLADKGVGTLLDCIQNPTSPEIVPQCLKVLEDICSHPAAAEKAFASGTVQTINNLLASNADLVVTAGCIRVLEKTSKSNTVLEMLIAEGSIQTAVRSLAYIFDQEACGKHMDAILAGAKLASRALKDTKAVADMRSADGISTFLRISENCPEEGVVRLSNRILNRLMGNSVEDMLHNLRAPDTTPLLYQQSLSMLSTMTSNESNAQRLVEIGGLGTIVGILQQDLPANIVAATAKTICNVATVNAEALRDCNAIDSLLHTLNTKALPPESKAQMIEALSKVCSSEVLLPELMSKGGIDTIQQALQLASNGPSLALASAQFITGLAQSSSLELLADGNLTSKLLDSMRETTSNRQVQLEGMGALMAMSASPAHLASAIEQGALEVVLSAMSEAKDPEVLQRAVQSMIPMVQTSVGQVRFTGSNALISIASTLDVEASEIDMRKAIAELVQSLNSEEILNSNVSRLLDLCANGAASKLSEQAAVEVLHSAQALRAACVVPDNTERLKQIGGINAILSAFEAVNQVDEPYHALALRNLTSVLQEVAVSSIEYQPDVHATIVRTCITGLEKQAKKPDVVSSILNVLSSLPADEDDQQLVLNSGVVQAITAALKAHATDGKVILPAAQELLRLAKDPRLAVEIARQNCTRQLIQCLKSNADITDEQMAEALKTVVLVLDAVARHEEGNAIISKQGGVSSIFAIMDAHHTDEAFVASCVRAIETLTSADDVVEILRKIQANVSPAHVRTANAEALNKIARDIDRLGLLLLCDDFAPVVTAEGGISTLQSIMTAAEKVAASPERNELLTSCVKALGHAAVGQVTLADSTSLAPVVVQVASENPTTQSMEAISSLTKDPSMAASLIAAGSIGAVLHACEFSSAGDVELSKASFKALSSLCLIPQGATQVVLEGGLRFVCEHITETLYDSDVSALDAGVKVLQSLAGAAAGVDLVKGGVLDVLDEVLDSVSNRFTAKTFSDVISILSKLAADPAVASQIASHEVVKKVVRTMKSKVQYVHDERVVSEVAELFETLAAGENAQSTLMQCGAEDILFDMMKHHPNKVDVLKRLAKTTSVLHGNDEASVAAFVDRIEQLLPSLAADTDESQIAAELSDTIAMVSNITLIDGILDQSTTDRLVNSLASAMAVLREKSQSGSVANCLAACLSALGKLLAVEAVKVDADVVAEAVTASLAITSQNDASSPVVQSAATCIGNLATTSDGIAVIASRGMLAAVKNAGARKAKVGIVSAQAASQEITNAIEAITQQAMSHATTLVGQPGGARLIAEILMGMADMKAVRTTLAQIAGMGQGVATLLQLLPELQNYFPAPSPKLISSIVSTLLSHRDYVVIATEADVNAVLGAMAAEPQAILLLNTDGFDSSVIGRSRASLEQILALLSHESAIVRLNAVTIVARLVGLNDAGVNAELVDTFAGRAVMNSMKSQQEAEYHQNALYLLYSLTQTVGFEQLKLSKEVMRVVQDVVAAFPDNEYIASSGNMLLYVLAEAFAGAAESLLEDRLRKLHVTQQAAEWVQVWTDDGKVYYYNRSTQETSWEQAPEYAAFVQDLDAAIRLVDTLHRNLAEVDVSTAVCLIDAVRSHGRDQDVLSKVVTVVSAQANDPAQAKVIAQYLTVGELLNAMQFHLTNTNILRNGMQVVEKIAQISENKDADYLDHISSINGIISGQSGDAQLVEGGFLALGHLVNNDAAAVARCVELQIPVTCGVALQAHVDNEAAVLATLQLLAMLVNKSLEAMRAVAVHCVEQLVAIGYAYMEKLHIYTRVVRLLGRLSALDANIVLMVQKHTIALVSQGLTIHSTNKELVSISVSVLNNIGAIDENEDEDNATDEEVVAQVEQALLAEGGVMSTVSAVKLFAEDLGVLTVGLGALYNVSNTDATDLMEQHGIVELTLKTLDKFDYEVELAQQCAKLLSVLTYSDSAVEKLTAFDGVSKLMQTVDTRVEDEEFLHDLLTAISNSVGHEKNIQTFEEIDGATTLLMLMEKYSGTKEIVCTILTALGRLAASDALSSQIAEKGMHIIMKELSTSPNDMELLAHVFKLFERLVFVKTNLQILVQHGGITALIDALSSFRAEPDFLAQTVRALENVVSASEEFSAIVVEKGGKQAVEQLKGVHADHEELQSAVNDFFLSMNAMSRAKDREGTKVNRGALFARLSGLVGAAMPTANEKLAEPEGDPLEEFRNLLQSGQAVQEYRGGSPTMRILVMSPEWDALMLRNPHITNKKLDRYLVIRKIKEVKKGYGPGHTKRALLGGFKSSADEEKCLYIGAAEIEDDMCVECSSKADRDRWALALQQLCHVHRHWPHLVRP